MDWPLLRDPGRHPVYPQGTCFRAVPVSNSVTNVGGVGAASGEKPSRESLPSRHRHGTHHESVRAQTTDKGRTLAGVLPRPGGEGGVVGVVSAP